MKTPRSQRGLLLQGLCDRANDPIGFCLLLNRIPHLATPRKGFDRHFNKLERMVYECGKHHIQGSA